jgi:hypothetical protein
LVLCVRPIVPEIAWLIRCYEWGDAAVNRMEPRKTHGTSRIDGRSIEP